MIIKKAVCMHEEDYGTLWKHTEYRTGHSEVRRSRRLVLSFISTIANYEYGFYWYFYQVWAQSCSCTSACADFWYACCPGAIAEPLADLRSSNLPPLAPSPNTSGVLSCSLRCPFGCIYCIAVSEQYNAACCYTFRTQYQRGLAVCVCVCVKLTMQCFM